MSNHQMQITKDLPNKRLTVTRQFSAAPEEVWKAWTESQWLDQWWAPKPWRAETKRLDFKEGGTWLYAMLGPEGEKHWSRVDFLTIDTPQSFSAITAFSNEEGIPVKEMGESKWENRFDAVEGGTKVTVNILFESEADMQKLIDMGFEQGFEMGLSNLDELLQLNLETDSKPK